MVAGDICEPPPLKLAVGPAEAADVGDRRSNGLLAFWLTPVDGADDDFDDVSALRASIADDAAPKARNMARLQQYRAARANHSCMYFSKRHAKTKNPIKRGFPAFDPIRQTRQ
jgi:hypothetical protein